MTLSQQEQQDIINSIKKSKTFSKAPTSQALLQYLFEATQKGTDLKEGLVELEFFKQPKNSDKNNARVRVNIYNLRKKLDKFYLEEGKNEAYKVVIDKGQYEVRFERKKTETSLLGKIRISIVLPYILLFISALVFLILLLPPKKPLIWESFLSKKNTTTLYIGDNFGFLGKTITGQFGWIRNYDINTIKEFYQFRDRHPEIKSDVKPATYTYTTGMAVLSTQKLQNLFQRHKRDFNIRFSTKTSISEIIEGNAIYVGPIKNNNPFINFFNTENPYFKINGDHLSFFNHPTKKDTTFNLFTRGIASEYAIVSKIPGPGGTEQFIFFSNHDIGVISTVEFFTNTDSLRNFEKKYLDDSAYFTAIFEANGLDRTNTDLELIFAVGH